MNYPTLAEVEAADLVQLATWHRFLPSPGANASSAIPVDPEPHDEEAWEAAVDADFAILRRIIVRLQQLGGWTAELSRTVGFSAPSK